MKQLIRGPVYVLGDNIDTDQIIPAQYLVLNPAIPEERKQFGRYALSAVPKASAGLPYGNIPFVQEGAVENIYRIIVAGKNFGCGSSREHAPLALQQAGVEAVVAEFYARIFFRNAVNGGYLVPFETPQRLCEVIRTGQAVELDIPNRRLTVIDTDQAFELKPLGEILPILEAGDVFAYARQAGMLK